MKNLYIFLTIVIIINFFSCTNESFNIDESLTPDINLRNNELDSGSNMALISLLTNYHRQHRYVEPELIFPGLNIDPFKLKFDSEKDKMASLGVINYIDNTSLKENIKAILKGSYEIVAEDPNFDRDDLVVKFESYFNGICIGDDEYCLIHNYIHTLFADYQNGDIQLRSGCGFVGFFEEVLLGITTGFETGATTFDEATLLSFGLSIVGAAVGTVVGTIIGIFTFNSDCSDCGPITGLSIQSDDNCDLSRTFAALGGGDDAAGYTWTISQNGSSASFITLSSLLQVTQDVSSEQVTISVRTVCEDDEDAGLPFVETFDLNVIDIKNPLGQAGNLIINHTCPYEGNTGGPSNYNCNAGFEEHSFYIISSNQASGNIIYEWDISPNTYSQNNNNSNMLKVVFLALDTYTLNFRAINNCTGHITERSQTIDILF